MKQSRYLHSTGPKHPSIHLQYSTKPPESQHSQLSNATISSLKKRHVLPITMHSLQLGKLNAKCKATHSSSPNPGRSSKHLSRQGLLFLRDFFQRKYEHMRIDRRDTKRNKHIETLSRSYMKFHIHEKSAEKCNTCTRALPNVHKQSFISIRESLQT